MSPIPVLATSSSFPRLRLASRMAAAVFGGYAFTWGFIAAAMALLFKAGMEFHDAEFLASAVGLLLYLVIFLGTVASRRRLALTWLALLGGGAALAAVGSLVQASVA
ncbi:MAG: iron uptake protein [Stenotrophomonas sp.]